MIGSARGKIDVLPRSRLVEWLRGRRQGHRGVWKIHCKEKPQGGGKSPVYSRDKAIERHICTPLCYA
jgi:hypothetical protein